MGISWTPGIGDPTAMGWFTVAAYFGAATMCAGAAMRAESFSASVKLNPLDRSFWVSALCIFLFLGVNKQLDLQSLFTELARAAAKAQDWYAERRQYQAAFVGAVGLATAMVLSWLLWRLRRSPGPVKLAILGLAFTCIFIVVRAASFHHVDRWLGTRLLGIRWNWIVELTGIAIVAIAAVRYNRPGAGMGK